MGTKLAIVAAAVFAALPSSAFGATVSVNPATLELLYRAAPGELNDVQLSKTEEIVTITDAGPVISVGFGCTQISDHEVACSGATYANIYVGDLDDRAASLAARPFSLFIYGEGGNDHLTLCSRCGGVLFGGSKADTLEGGHVQSYLDGGDGPDILRGGASYDVIDGGAGATRSTGAGTGTTSIPETVTTLSTGAGDRTALRSTPSSRGSLSICVSAPRPGKEPRRS